MSGAKIAGKCGEADIDAVWFLVGVCAPVVLPVLVDTMLEFLSTAAPCPSPSLENISLLDGALQSCCGTVISVMIVDTLPRLGRAPACTILRSENPVSWLAILEAIVNVLARAENPTSPLPRGILRKGCDVISTGSRFSDVYGSSAPVS